MKHTAKSGLITRRSFITWGCAIAIVNLFAAFVSAWDGTYWYLPINFFGAGTALWAMTKAWTRTDVWAERMPKDTPEVKL